MKHFQHVLVGHLRFKSEVTITKDVIEVFQEGILDRRLSGVVGDGVFIEKIVLVARPDPLRCMSMIIRLRDPRTSSHRAVRRPSGACIPNQAAEEDEDTHKRSYSPDQYDSSNHSPRYRSPNYG